MPEKPELVYDELQIGKEFEPYHLAITQGVVDNFLQAIGEEDSIYANVGVARKWGFDQPLAPQSLAAVYARASYLKDYNMPGGGILAKQEFHFSHPIFVGDEIICKARVADRFLRKERKYVVIEIVTHNLKGQQISLVRIEAIWPK
jgi:3-hydroxybutyryl-CoA dehydratase